MHPAPVIDVDAIAALRNDLGSAGYTTDKIAELLGPTATAALHRDQHVVARRVLAQPLAEGNLLAGFISCFMLADPISRELADTMFATLSLDQAVTLGIVTMSAHDQVRATLDLSAYATDDSGDLWVISDQTALQLGKPLPAEHILGVGKASLTLAEITPRHEVETALDIGTGCGIQALHLLTHCRHVTMTDVSERALAFAVFNVLLNAPNVDVDPHDLFDRVSVAVGNMLEPVAEKTFDLVVTNPPFVIAPATSTVTHTYRETAATGDQLVADLVSNLDAVLADGAEAIMLANWEMFGNTDPWSARLQTWPDDTLDMWAIQRSSSDPAQYAEMWLQDSSEHLNPSNYEEAYANYVADFQARGVTQIGFGWLWFRKRRGTAAPLRKFEYLTQPVHQPVAHAWATSIRRYDAVHAHSADGWALADVHLVAPDWVTSEQYQRFTAEHPEVLMARSGAGFGRHVQLDTASAAVLGAADGELTAGQIVAAVAGLLALDTEQTQALQDNITGLYVDGFVDVFLPR